MELKPLRLVNLHLSRYQAETIQKALAYRMKTVATAAGYDKHLTPREVYEKTGGSNGRDDLTVTETVFRDLYSAAYAVEAALEDEEERVSTRTPGPDPQQRLTADEIDAYYREHPEEE